MRPIARAVAIAAAAAMLAAVAARGGVAQTTAPTLTAPKAQPKSSPPAAKAAPVGRANPCSIYGEGFANVPGTDTCVKAGGYVRSDVGVNAGR